MTLIKSNLKSQILWVYNVQWTYNRYNSALESTVWNDKGFLNA